MIMERELIPSIFWNDHAYSCQWQPNPKKSGGLLLCKQYDEDDLVQCEFMCETFHLKLPTKTGVSQYYFQYGTLGLYDGIEEFGKSWYKLAEISSHSEASAIINQDDIEHRCIFMLEGIECQEILGDIPARLNALIGNESFKQLQEVEKPLSARTENNYLRLILTLANGIDGFNPKKPYEAAQLIIDETGIDISQQTISDYITKAYKIESQKRD